MDLNDLNNKELCTFLFCLERYGKSYYEVTDLLGAVYREYLRRFSK